MKKPKTHEFGVYVLIAVLFIFYWAIIADMVNHTDRSPVVRINEIFEEYPWNYPKL